MYYAAVEKIMYNWNEFWNRRDIEIVYLDLQVCHRWYIHLVKPPGKWFAMDDSIPCWNLWPKKPFQGGEQCSVGGYLLLLGGWKIWVLCGWFVLFLFFSFLFISFPFLFFYIHYIHIYSILFYFILIFFCVSETSGASLLFSNRDIPYPLGMGEVFVHVFGSGGVGIGWGLWCAGACHSIVTRRPLKF